MRSFRSQEFREHYQRLPVGIQRLADRAYHRFARNPEHPGLQFKPIRGLDGVYSIRIGIHYRALRVLEGDAIVWFWIGTHADYDRLVKG